MKRIQVPSGVSVVEILGQYDHRAKVLKKKFDVDIAVAEHDICIRGENEKNLETVENILNDVVKITNEGHLLDKIEFEYLIDEYADRKNTNDEDYPGIYGKSLLNSRVKPKTLGQKRYIEAIEKNDIVFSIGPAGTGKTYIAAAVALDYLRSGRVQRIILTRPAVEAGEKLGFLPGDLAEKVDPYLRPLFDAMVEMIPVEKFMNYREKGVIEIAPLAYMRGRTLNNSFVILDEAQNTTHEQMKMFLTRLGFNSKTIVTGDITQIDIEKKSGFSIIYSTE